MDVLFALVTFDKQPDSGEMWRKIRETQLNFELSACAAHCRGNCISGTKASVLGFGVLSEDHAGAGVERRLQAFLGSSR